MSANKNQKRTLAIKDLVFLCKRELCNYLWEADPSIKKILTNAQNLNQARDKLFDYLNQVERHYFNLYSDKHFRDLHICERANAKECIHVLKNIIRTENERLTNFSALKQLFRIAKKTISANVSEGFISEFIYLFRGINGKSELATEAFLLPSDAEEYSLLRSQKLDDYSIKMNKRLKKYKKGTDPEIVQKQRKLKNKIIKYLDASPNDWKDYHWHLKHIIRDSKTLSDLVQLDELELESLQFAEKNHIPFQITPYYLSLFNQQGKTKDDMTIRAQVLPSKTYCQNVIENREKNVDMDFMGEKTTSPIDGITRRYPQIVILKPVETCPQLCVYCQRNWEIKTYGEKNPTRRKTHKAIEWIKNNKNITELLITGGDPLLLTNKYLNLLLSHLAKIPHIERIRIGTRMLVTLPFRIDEKLVQTLRQYHKPGKREICLVTHFEDPCEVTPPAIEAIQKIRQAGMSIYNQQVFTYFNSFKYKTCALRKTLKLAGVDPYYIFNTKGKDETIEFRVPIARIEQEREEESRFLPGLVRTDAPVFNVPKLGKSHLESWQTHEIIMILDSGQRVYRFYPWEAKASLVDDYIYTDVSIYDYLKRLENDGEDINDYRSIWFYF